MIFKRRDKRGWLDQLRDLVIPRKSWRRGFQYIGRRVQRLPDTPHRIAVGFACGVLASFTPFFTLHIFVAVFFALLVRGNLIAAAFGTIFGNPITFPLIAASSLKLGNYLLGRNDGVENLDALSWEYVTTQPIAFLESIFSPYLIGGMVPGLLSAAICYVLLRPLVARFQRRRRTLLEARARELIQARRRGTRQGQVHGQTSATAAARAKTQDPRPAAAEASSPRRASAAGAADPEPDEPARRARPRPVGNPRIAAAPGANTG